MADYGVDPSLISDTNYGLSDLNSLSSVADIADVGSNTDFGATADYPTDWWNDASAVQMDDWAGGTYTGSEGDSWLGNIGTGIMNAGKSTWDFLGDFTNNPFGKQVMGLGLNYLMNNIGNNKTGSPPSYQSMQTPTQMTNDPYYKSMMDQTSKQVTAASRARGTQDSGYALNSLADAAYARNLLPMLQIASGQNQAQNQMAMQGWSGQAQQNNNLYGGLGQGLNNIMNTSAEMDMVDQLVAKILGPAASPAEKQGAKDAAEGKPPQSNDPEYLKGYNKLKGA